MAKSNRSGQAAVFSPAQLTQLWTELDQPYRVITQVCYYTAARCGEVVSLERGDLQGDRIVYRAAKTKTRTTREAMVTQQLREAIAVIEKVEDIAGLVRREGIAEPFIKNDEVKGSELFSQGREGSVQFG